MSIKIDQALTNALLTGSLALDIVHDGGSKSIWGGAAYVSSKGAYSPSTKRAYLEEKTFISDTSTFSSDSNDTVGVYQCIVRYPSDSGSFDAKTKAEQILTLLAAGTKITYSGTDVNIISNRRDGGREEGGYYQIVVRANFRAFE